MNNPFEEIEKKLDEVISKVDSQHRWIKLSKWCKDTGVSYSYALDVFESAISRPSGRMYMIDIVQVNKLIEECRIKRA